MPSETSSFDLGELKPEYRHRELIEEFSKMKPQEREEVLAAAEERDEDSTFPRIGWLHEPSRAKATFQFLGGEPDNTATFEELREHLADKDLTKCDSGEYNFGIVPRDDRNGVFTFDGARDADTPISLTETGEEIAGLFEGDSDTIRPIERAILLGLQPFGGLSVLMAILERNRENGILRQDLIEEMGDTFGGSSKNYTSTHKSFLEKVGLLRSEKEGRKARYYPEFSESWTVEE